LVPFPDDKTLDDFYESQYRDLLDEGGRAPDLARLMAGGPEADRERQWLAATVHADVADALSRHVPADMGRRVLDVGAGTGDLVLTLVAEGWEAEGTEPARDLAEAGVDRGARIATATLAEFQAVWAQRDRRPFSAVVLMNVLEHVREPEETLRLAGSLVAEGGIVIVRVPNDFNPLQRAVVAASGVPAWWIVAPDHLNYFDHASLGAIVERAGFTVRERWSDFPMEIFLLMGDMYVGAPEIGQACHERRRRFELSIDAATRRALGRAWAMAGIGRNASVVAARSA
jgi:2-polyprenyl-3-methyl-5-hydroxy-6-metoxy-1,4-benzoquinol methylase